MKKVILLLLLSLVCNFKVIHASEIKDSKEGNVPSTKSLDSGKVRDFDMERFLKADGKVLRNKEGKGDVVTLVGTNVGGWQVMEAWMCPTDAKDQLTTMKVFTDRFGKEVAEELIKVYEDHWWREKDFDNVLDLNFNVLRLPISYINLLDENGILRADTLATYDWFVDECEKRDIYVILDLHAAPGSQNGKDHSGDSSASKLYQSKEYRELTISLWKQLAAHYKGNPTIAGYDLLNEPEGTEEEKSPWGGVQMPFYDELYKAVREVDEDHLIIFEAIWEATDMPDPSEYGWENVMYQYHFYGWDGIEDANKQKKFIDSKIVLDERTNFDVPVLIGEFTFFTNLSSWEYGLSVFKERGWSYTTWTYKTVEYGNWGIYTSKKSDTPDVNIYHDEKDVIVDKWSKIGTSDSFTRNKYLADILKVMADEDKAQSNTRKWYHNFTTETKVYGEVATKVEVVPGKEVTAKLGDSNILKYEILEDKSLPQGTRYFQLLPMVRDTIDVRGMDYLLIDAFVRKGISSFQVILVDKDGKRFVTNTFKDVPPLTHGWEKLMVDIEDASIDKSAIAQILIGTNSTGIYYFKDIYFGQSYVDSLPTESLEEMEKDKGVSVTLPTFSQEKVVSDNKYLSNKNLTILGIFAIASVIFVGVYRFFKIKSKLFKK